MEKTLQLDVVTPDKVVLCTHADYVGAPGVDGEFGVLPYHIPLLAGLGTGCLTIKKGNARECAFVSGGFVEVSYNKITVLADSAELAGDIDLGRAERAKERAEKRLAVSKEENVNVERAHAALRRALARIQVYHTAR